GSSVTPGPMTPPIEHSATRASIWHRLVRAEPGELAPLARSAAFFFCVLFGYFLLRPVREAMGVERGMDELSVLFVVTACASLVIAMLFGTLIRRLDRRRFIPIGFRLVIASLVLFAVGRLAFGEAMAAFSGRAFYVWLSVVNLFLTSLFWAYMADVWSLDQGKRLFAAVGVGGTLGALAGSSVPWFLSAEIERLASRSIPAFDPAGVSAAALMLLAAMVFEVAVRRMLSLDRARPESGPPRQEEPEPASVRADAPLEGVASGLIAVARSPYLIGIGLYIALIAVSSTMIYFTQARIVVDAEDDLVGRIRLFGSLDMLAQILTLLVQLFVTSRMIRAIGVGGTLGVLPVVTFLGFAALWLVSDRVQAAPYVVFGVFATFQAVHRAARYAVARPARETLFSVLDRDKKYNAKLVVDLFLYRGGDVAGTGIESLLTSAAVVAFGSLLVGVAPLSVLWIGLGLALAATQARRAHAASDDPQSLDLETQPSVAGSSVTERGTPEPCTTSTTSTTKSTSTPSTTGTASTPYRHPGGHSSHKQERRSPPHRSLPRQ
ncbi:MAG: Npt1/Npt2 family nucleotide transporter, partial [Planctomycetota bacterium]